MMIETPEYSLEEREYKALHTATLKLTHHTNCMGHRTLRPSDENTRPQSRDKISPDSQPHFVQDTCGDLWHVPKSPSAISVHWSNKPHIPPNPTHQRATYPLDERIEAIVARSRQRLNQPWQHTNKVICALLVGLGPITSNPIQAFISSLGFASSLWSTHYERKTAQQCQQRIERFETAIASHEAPSHLKFLLQQTQSAHQRHLTLHHSRMASEALFSIAFITTLSNSLNQIYSSSHMLPSTLQISTTLILSIPNLLYTANSIAQLCLIHSRKTALKQQCPPTVGSLAWISDIHAKEITQTLPCVTVALISCASILTTLGLLLSSSEDTQLRNILLPTGVSCYIAIFCILTCTQSHQEQRLANTLPHADDFPHHETHAVSLRMSHATRALLETPILQEILLPNHQFQDIEDAREKPSGILVLAKLGLLPDALIELYRIASPSLKISLTRLVQTRFPKRVQKNGLYGNLNQRDISIDLDERDEHEKAEVSTIIKALKENNKLLVGPLFNHGAILGQVLIQAVHRSQPQTT